MGSSFLAAAGSPEGTAAAGCFCCCRADAFRSPASCAFDLLSAALDSESELSLDESEPEEPEEEEEEEEESWTDLTTIGGASGSSGGACAGCGGTTAGAAALDRSESLELDELLELEPEELLELEEEEDELEELLDLDPLDELELDRLGCCLTWGVLPADAGGTAGAVFLVCCLMGRSPAIPADGKGSATTLPAAVALPVFVFFSGSAADLTCADVVVDVVGAAAFLLLLDDFWAPRPAEAEWPDVATPPRADWVDSDSDGRGPLSRKGLSAVRIESTADSAFFFFLF